MRRPPVTWLTQHPPAPAALAQWSNADGHLTLGLPGLGSVRVSREGLAVLGPDPTSRARTWARLGEWATAQWAVARGCFVVRGAVVARDDQAFAITGGVRCGASLLALVLGQRGWGLVSDGLAVIGPDLVALALEPEVTVDADSVRGLQSAPPAPVREAGRPRVRVRLPGHSGARVTGLVVLTRSHRATGLTVTAPADLDRAGDTLRATAIRCDLPGVTLAPPPVLPGWRVHRPQAPADPAVAAASSPLAIATALEPLLTRHRVAS